MKKPTNIEEAQKKLDNLKKARQFTGVTYMFLLPNSSEASPHVAEGEMPPDEQFSAN